MLRSQSLRLCPHAPHYRQCEAPLRVTHQGHPEQARTKLYGGPRGSNEQLHAHHRGFQRFSMHRGQQLSLDTTKPRATQGPLSMDSYCIGDSQQVRLRSAILAGRRWCLWCSLPRLHLHHLNTPRPPTTAATTTTNSLLQGQFAMVDSLSLSSRSLSSSQPAAWLLLTTTFAGNGCSVCGREANAANMAPRRLDSCA